jgi:SAM-dependent methyltransferase
MKGDGEVSIYGLFAPQALARLLKYTDAERILDIGSGLGLQAQILRSAGRHVTTLSLLPPADIIGDYLDFNVGKPFDAIWASHVLEHQPDVGAFLRKCFADLREDGILAVTVPPLKDDLVGGHVALFNQGTLVYNLILAGFDCADARVSPVYANAPDQPPYNISVIVRKKHAELPADLTYDAGDIERLAHFFPCPVAQNCDGTQVIANW